MTTQKSSHAPKGYVIFGAAIHSGAVNLQFRLDRPYAGCRLCGQLYQSDLDRAPNHLWALLQSAANFRRKRWIEVHRNRYHTQAEADAFEATGLAFTPEAAHRLAPFGIVAPFDTIRNDTVHALGTAPRAPVNDVEGT